MKLPIYTFNDAMNLDQIVKVLNAEVDAGRISLKNMFTATIGGREGTYGDDFSVVIRAITIEHEKHYEKEMVKYKKKKAEYGAWWAKNGEKITNVRKEREQNEKESRIKRLEKEIERLKNG